MFLAVTLLVVLFLTLLLIIRLKSQMAALVAWLVGTITGGSRNQESNEEEIKRKKGRQKSKKTCAGELSSSSTTPIEEAIAEALKEDSTQQSDNVESKSPNKLKKRNKHKKKTKSPEHAKDDIGFSFFKTESFDSIENREQIDEALGIISNASTSQQILQESSKEQLKPKKVGQKSKTTSTEKLPSSIKLTTPVKEVIAEVLKEDSPQSDSLESKSPRKPKKRSKHKKEVESADSPLEDPLGFSFLPGKKNQRRREKTKVDDLPQSSLIEHFQPKRRKENAISPEVRDEFVVIDKAEVKSEEPVKKNLIELRNRSTGQVVHLEAKESKKVHAKISYASVASQRFEESLERLRVEEEQLNRATGLEVSSPNEEVENFNRNFVNFSQIIQTEVQPSTEESRYTSNESEASAILLQKNKDQENSTSGTNDFEDESETVNRNILAEPIVVEDPNQTVNRDSSRSKEETTEENFCEEKFSETIVANQITTEHINKETDLDRNEEFAFEVELVHGPVTGLFTGKQRTKTLSAEDSVVEETAHLNTEPNEEPDNLIQNVEEENISDTSIEIINNTTSSLNSEVEESTSLDEEVEEIGRDSSDKDQSSEEEEEEEFQDIGSEINNIIKETLDFNKDNTTNEVKHQKSTLDEKLVEIEETAEETNKESFSGEVFQNIAGETNISSVKVAVTEDLNQEVDLDKQFTQETSHNSIRDHQITNSETEYELPVNTHEEVAVLENPEEITQLSQAATEEQHPISVREVVEKNILDTPSRAEEIVNPKPFKMSSGIQVRVLTLNDKEHQDSVLYRIEKNWILQFRLGPSLLGRKVSLFCNYPKEGEEFNRHTYQLLKWSQDEGCSYSDDTALLTEITPKISGSFHYYFTYENAEEEGHQGSGFFLVDPVLKYGKDEELPLDCIQCQTVLAKGLGPFDTWESKLRVAKESGYNMIHFTPVQELGISNSSYSLSEQLKVNPLFTKQNGEETTFKDIESLISKLRTEWKVVSICDIVLNHTANESEWLREHPEATYNCQTCPYMRPAYLLDAAIHQFSAEIAKGNYEDKGIPIEVNTEEHLNSIRYYLQTDVFAKIKIHEMFMCDVNNSVMEFLNLARSKVPPVQDKLNTDEELELTQDPLYRRLASTIDMNLALKLYNVYRHDCFDEETRLKRCSEDFKSKLDSLNAKITEEVNDHLKAAIDNIVAAIRYFRVQPDGPRIKEVSVKKPLLHRYFTDYGTPGSIEEHEAIMYGDNGRFLMAHNGWVMNSDPLRNFAAPGSNVYLRRELIAWGDSVKLRYGDKPEDCPFLWNHMKTYVEQTARIFDGVRLDNCHSTPIPVAEYLLDCARKVRPDLYVVAELFTNSDLTDNIFVNRLGIASLIREAMAAWDSHEQGRLVYRYGGSPVGSFYQPRVRPLVPSIAHALFLDLTHDNPSPVEKRSVFDLLPSTALVNMACCASGSNRGYDELVPHHIHVVDENRQYTEWADDDNLAMGDSRYVTKNSGIVAAKKALNDLHFHLGLEGFNQVYVDQMDPDIVAITRHCPETHESYVLVAFTAFGHPEESAAVHQRSIKPLRVEGVLDEIVLEATLSHISAESSGSKFAKFQNFHKDTKWINGLSEYQIHLRQHLRPEESEIFERVDSGSPNVIQLNFKNFKPSSIAVIKVSLPEDMNEAIKKVRKLISQFSLKKETELTKVINEMTLPDLNRTLYRCDQEERDEGYGFDTYNIPNFGPMVYAGLQGFMSLLSNIRPSNDLGHPMCANLRDGNWMIDYIWQRLKLDTGTKSLGQWFEENTKSLKQIPRYLVPCYFDVILTGMYVLLLDRSHKLMSDFVKNGSAFVKGLAMGSLQFSAYIKSADLPLLSPNLTEPKPPQRHNEKGELVQACVTLSAGLPHFSVGYTRNWGRDTFIALRGLFLLTGRHQDARYHILGYGACLRHGLIPNLLDGGRNSRFNCRDAVWWWLYCIKCYVEEVPNGSAILSDKVSRLFPTDDSPPQPAGATDQPLYDVMQKALKVHFQGLVFRERNAGRQIDEHMSDQGFNNQIGIHPETGFVFGGNGSNCGTWMDKMGSSDKAGNRGKPATPRDGSAIELIGLSKAVVSWLGKLHEEGVYPYSGVERTHKNGNVTKWSFKEWAEKIQGSFERCFWVNVTPESGEIRPDLINKRGIYKDCYGTSQEWTDFQLRCNFPIAMVAAPELFDPEHAWIALKKAEKYLLGPLGMKTLDPEDWAYNGNYDNSNDSGDFKLAHGFNYHQGPEWVWPMGYYLRAKLQFAAANGELAKTVANTKVVLSRHFVELQTSVWRGLPELTNQNGAFCKDSSRTQAWSMSSILEVLYDLQKIEKDQLLIN